MRIGLLITIAAIACPACAWAQSDGASSELEAEAGDKIVYNEAYFAQYELQNAQDMLRRVPGVSAILSSLGGNSQVRGFGSGGDRVLVNGRRFPGKANDISRTLSRLRAENVERVELIRGTSRDIDVQSTGVVVNIVLRKGASLGSGGTFEVATRGNNQGKLGVDGLASYAGSSGSLGFNVGIERNLWAPDGNGGTRWTNRYRDENYFYPDGLIQELRPQFWERDHDRWIFTAGLTYDLPGGPRVQLNGLYETLRLEETDRTNITRFDRRGVQVDTLIEEHGRTSGPATTLELSGEFTAQLGGGGLTVLAIGSSRKQPTLDERYSIRSDRRLEISRNITTLSRTEYIGRFQYSLPLSGGLGLKLGGEGASNKLTQDLVPFFDVDGDGTVETIEIPTANARVEELRGEVFAELKWTASTALSVNASFNFEHSKLTTNSIFNPGRTLAFWKPRLDIRYVESNAGLLRLLIEKQVSQLDFANFVPRYNVQDDRIDAGNLGLLPEQVWNFELGYEHRLPNDVGVIEGILFYRAIGDAIDSIPLQQGPVIVSAQGNLGQARAYGTEITASLRLIPLGLRDAVLSVTGELQGSRAIDPFTREPRRLRSDSIYNFSVGFRHDLRPLNISYGFDYRNLGVYRIQSDLFSRDLFRIGPLLSVFAEKRVTGNLVLRGEAQNLLGGKEYRERQIFAINQMDGVIRRLDRFREARDLRYAIIVKGTF